MSLDLAVWRTETPLGDAAASELYAVLARGDVSRLQPHPAVDAFYADLVARYPELHDVPAERVDDSSYCPWSCSIDKSPAHLILSCVPSVQESVGDFIGELQRKHKVSVYMPSSGQEYFPDD